MAGSRERQELCGVWVCMVAVTAALSWVLLFWGGSAFGAQTRKLVGSFGALNSPQGLAVQQSTGDVYVADAGNNRILKFDALGNQLLAFGGDVGGAGIDTCATVCAPGTQGAAAGEFTSAQFLAVDNSAGPSSGDVYVGDVGDERVSKFDSSGNLLGSWGSGGQLDGSSTGAKVFGIMAGIAVDAAGTLHVFNIERQLFKFAQDGTFESELRAGERDVTARGFGVDGEKRLFRSNGDGSIEKLESSGSSIGTVTPDGAPPAVASAFAVDANDNGLYVASEGETLDHYAFSAPGEVVEPAGASCVVEAGVGCKPSDSLAIPFAATGIAVNSESKTVYAANPGAGEVFEYVQVTIPDVATEAAAEVHPTSATFNGTVNPDGVALTDCHFEYGTSEAYGQSASCVPAADSISGDSNSHVVSADVSGLEAGVAYHYRLVAGNENGSNVGEDVSLATPPPPSIDNATAKDLTGDTAILTAKINPRGFDTSYHFEYGTDTSYGARVPLSDEDIGTGDSDVLVAKTIAGLSKAKGVTYHWRVVAISVNGTTLSSDHTFVYEASGPPLPDGRAYEMVTPAQKDGTLIGSALFGSPDVAGSGGRVIAKGIQCFAGAESCTASRKNAIGEPNEFLRTSAGWAARAMAPPSSLLSVSSPWGYSADAGTGLFSGPQEPFGGDEFYARQPSGSFLRIGPVTPVGGGPQGPAGGGDFGAEQALSPDLSHIVWETGAPGRWPFDETTGELLLYEYGGAGEPQPLMVGVTGGRGARDLVSVCGTVLGGQQDSGSPGAMSSDGRTVYFTAVGGEGCVGSGANAGAAVGAAALYARIDGERPSAHTVAVSARSPSDCTEAGCVSSPGGDAQFVGASGDGSKVLFASTQRLMNQASEDAQPGDTAANKHCPDVTGTNGCNLYLYDFTNPTGRELADVSAGDASGGGPRVQGVVALSEDGSHVYFVAKGVLSSSVNAEGRSAREGANNLYVFEPDASRPTGRLQFIASLADSDRKEWAVGTDRPANVTPDGRYLAFLSAGRLTGDDTSVSGAQQVFRYDAQSGQLARVSAGNNGFNDGGNRATPTPCDPNRCSDSASIAYGERLARRNPTMSDDGRYVFFQSPVALTAGALDDVQIATDENGEPVYAQNIYEWNAGHVYLISDGRDVSVDAGQAPRCANVSLSSVCLLGSDASGTNVFFSTVDRLVSTDSDTELDYYDARVCTGPDPCIKASAAQVRCRDEACQGSTVPQPPPMLAASVVFAGPGNTSPAVARRVRVLSHTVRGGTFLLKVSVPGPGRLSVGGAGVGSLRRLVAAAGIYRFAVSLTRGERASLRRHHRHRVALRLRVGFAPAGGVASAVSVSVAARV